MIDTGGTLPPLGPEEDAKLLSLMALVFAIGFICLGFTQALTASAGH